MNFLHRLDWTFYLQAFITLCVWMYIYYTWRTRIPLVFTSTPARQAVIRILRADIAARPPGQAVKIYDLGSGIGGLCLAAAKHFPAARVVGMEMAWPIWAVSVLRRMLCGLGNVQFIKGDFWRHDISDGDIVLFYLGDVVMDQMGEKLRREARAGRLIISNTFPLPKDWAPTDRIAVPGALSKEIIIYRQPN